MKSTAKLIDGVVQWGIGVDLSLHYFKVQNENTNLKLAVALAMENCFVPNLTENIYFLQ